MRIRFREQLRRMAEHYPACLEVYKKSTQVNHGEVDTTEHPDISLGIFGRVVGKLNVMVNYEVL